MNYPLTFINNLSNNASAYQSWENLGTMDVSSRTEVISTTDKKRLLKRFCKLQAHLTQL